MVIPELVLRNYSGTCGSVRVRMYALVASAAKLVKCARIDAWADFVLDMTEIQFDSRHICKDCGN